MRVIVMGLPDCPNCLAVKNFLECHDIEYTELDLRHPAIQTELRLEAIDSSVAPIVQINNVILTPNVLFRYNKLNPDILACALHLKGAGLE